MAAVVLTPLERQVYDELKRIATKEQTVTYGVLFTPFGIGDKKYRRRWAKILEHVSMHSYSGYPTERLYLSALVSNIDTGYPGIGFFKLDGIPGRLARVGKRLTAEQIKFVEDQRRLIWRHDWVARP